MVRGVRIASLVVILLLLAVPTVAVIGTGPDLVITDIDLAPENPAPGETTRIVATVKNQGDEEATESFDVQFWVDGTEIGKDRISFGLDAGRTKTAEVEWTATAGMHTIKVKADAPFGRIGESDEHNNELERTITVIQISGTSLESIVIAVARFDDRSGSGFINVGAGVADKLIETLFNLGLRVVERTELESVMLEQGLDSIQAGLILGADVLLIGSVTNVDIKETTISLGFISITGATVKVGMSLRAVSAYTSEIMAATSIEITEEGTTGFSINIGQLLGFLQGWQANVCVPGQFLTDKNTYYQGEMINIGYYDSTVSAPSTATYQVAITGPASTTLLPITLTSSGCATWTWSTWTVGNYTATLSCVGAACDPAPLTTSFTVIPGVAPPTPLISEITIGTTQFDETIVGVATNKALDQLVAKMIVALQGIAPQLIEQRDQYRREELLKGRVIEVWDDGTIVIGIGREAGVKRDDIFEVFEAKEIVDPNTGELIEVIPATGVPKGEIIITRVEDKVSLARRLEEFSINIGDLVVQKEIK